jgi:hypothetical protein
MPKIIINEFYRGGNLTTTDEFIEFLLLEDLTATELQNFFVGDSTGTKNAKFSAYQFTNMSSIASTFQAGTIITVGGTGAITQNTSYNPSGGDWNIELNAAGSFLPNANPQTNGDIGGDDVIWVDTTNTGSTISADGFAVEIGTSAGTFVSAANVNFGSGTNNTGYALNSDLTGATNTANWITGIAFPSTTPGQPNGGANTTYIDSLRSTIPNPSVPVVNLSVSSNTGSEANTTQITVTATASGNVSGAQTVDIAVSGTDITASDYYLTNTTITIPNGQNTGSVTFIVADDALVEATETATLTISNPTAGISLGATTSQNITITNNDNSFLTKIGGATSTNLSEIPAFDPGSDRLFVVASDPIVDGRGTVEIYTVSNTGSLTAAGNLTPGFTPPAGTELGPNSVTVNNGIVAVAYAVRNTTTRVQETGKVAFFNANDGSYINAVDVGALPDMLTFTPDGMKVLVANEGEPNSYGQPDSVDPEGSVSIIDLSNGAANATVQTATFTSFNSQINELRNAGVRIFGPGATVAQDLEPEYIAVSPDGQTAWITLQENNAVAILNIATATITDIRPLGLKDHSIAGNGLDASDRDVNGTLTGGGRINIANWPIFGLYQPDAIASFTVNGQTYYITANEGDARDYTGFAEEIRLGNAGYALDSTIFDNATTLKLPVNLGRLTVTNATGDTDGDGDFDRIEVFGARSFSIWNANGNQVFDSGDQLEQITAEKVPTLFNSGGAAGSFDERSDNKGPEPEGVVVGVIGDRTYAFIGLERVGDVIVYDVTDPNQPQLVQYINTPEDIGTEGLTFVSATDSPTGKPLLITASEVSRTITVFEININEEIPNSAPTVATPIVDQTATANSVFTFQFADNAFTDVEDGTNLTYTASLADNSPLPAWLTFTPATRTFSGTPPTAETLSIKVTATDSGNASVADVLELTINPDQTAPLLGVSNNLYNSNLNTLPSAQGWSYASLPPIITPTAASGVTNLNTLSDSNLYAGFSRTDQILDRTQGYSLSFTAQVLTETRTNTADKNNDGKDDRAGFSVIILSNDATPLGIELGFFSNSIWAQETGTTSTDPNLFTQAESVAFDTSTNPVDYQLTVIGNTYTIRAKDTVTNATATLSGNLRNYVPFVGPIDPYETPNFIFFGDDTTSAAANINLGSIALTTVVDAVTITENSTSVLNLTAIDVNGDIPTFSITGGADQSLFNIDTNTGALSFKNAANFEAPSDSDNNNVYVVEVAANDGQGGITTQTINVTVSNVNETPSVANAIANQIATVNSVFNFQFAANTFNDVDAGDTLTYTATQENGAPLPPWLSFDATTRTFSGTPPSVGTFSIKVTATDSGNASVEDVFELAINPANTAPTVPNTIADQTATVNSVFNFQFAANTFNDVDANDTLTYIATLENGDPLPTWLTFNAATRTFSGTPTTNGNFNIKVTATDQAQATVDDVFTLAVNPQLQITQLINSTNDIFQISSSHSSTKVKVTLKERKSPLVNELAVFTVDDDNGTINGITPGAAGYIEAAIARSQVIFSAIANIPNGFETNNLTRILEFDANVKFRFALIKNNTFDAVKAGSASFADIIFSSTSSQKITDLGNNAFSFNWRDGSNNNVNEFNDLVVSVQATDDSLPLGTRLQNNSQGELIDLTGIVGAVSAKFTVYREASYDSFVGFYRVTGVNGGIDINNDGVADLLPGQTGYIQAAVNQRVAGMDLTVNNQATATYTSAFAGGGIFVPFIIVNGRPEALLDSNSSNDPAIYFPFLGANADKSDHIRLLGNNVFGFEDLPGLGDRDYNDMIVKVDLSVV